MGVKMKILVPVRMAEAINEALRLVAAAQRPPVNRSDVINRAVWEYLSKEAQVNPDVAALIADATAEMAW